MPAVKVGGLWLAYREHGDGDPVLLINGTGESGRTWEATMRALGHRRRCVAYDARDTGDSTYVDATYTPRDLAGDAAGVIEALGLGPCHVVGFSLGGATAQELAIARPELVRSLVLLNTWARSDGWFGAQMRNWQSVRRYHRDDDRAFLQALEAWLLSPATMADPGARARVHRIWADDVEQAPDGWIRQCEADIAHDAAGRLGQVRAPALVIVGEDDACTPPRYARELCALLPEASLREIPAAGHCAVFERPDEVHAAIADFLSAVEAR